MKKWVKLRGTTFVLREMMLGSFTHLIGLNTSRTWVEESYNMLTDIEGTVLSVITEVLGDSEENIDMETTMYNSSKWDSLANIQIVSAIEKAIGHQLTLDEIITGVSVRNWVDIVQNKLGDP